MLSRREALSARAGGRQHPVSGCECYVSGFSFDSRPLIPFFNSVKAATLTYSLGVRLAHFLAIIVMLLLSVTGVRLAWFEGGFFSPEVNSLVDSLAPAGRTHSAHFALGMTFAAIGVFYLIYLLLSKEAPRLLALFLDRQYSFKKKFLYLLTLVVGLISFLSGVTLYCGLYDGPDGYTFMKYVHYYCFVFFLGFMVVHVIEVVISGRSKLNSIFFAGLHRGFFNAKVFGVSVLAALAAGIGAYMMIKIPATLVCREQNRYIVVDGREFDIEWMGADSLVVQTAGGMNFEGGASEVTIKAFHNGPYIYFLVKWTDYTRSYNRHLVKTKGGWVEQVSEYVDIFGESIYSEDKMALSFHKSHKGCLATCHVRAPDKMGLHHSGGDTVDVWQWMAVSTNPASEADDGWWGAYEDAIISGRHHDNIASGGSRSNLNEGWQQPYFLPQHLAMRDWIWIDSRDYVAYHPEIDSFAVGARVPAVLVAPAVGDRGDVKARGTWRNGVWTVEFARRLTTGSPFDAVFRGELYLGIAPFDNADSKHAYHLRPIRLVVE